MVYVGPFPNKWHHVRAIFDTGSETNIISERCAKNCGLKLEKSSDLVNGVGGSPSIKVLGVVTAYLKQLDKHHNIKLKFRVLSQTTLQLPSYPLPRYRWPHFDKLELADPNFHIPSPVDIIFTSGVLNQISCNERVESLRSSPVAHKTTLGWIISGSYSFEDRKIVTFSPDTRTSAKDCSSISPISSWPKIGDLTTSRFKHEPTIAQTNNTSHTSPTARQELKVEVPRPQRFSGPGFRYTNHIINTSEDFSPIKNTPPSSSHVHTLNTSKYYAQVHALCPIPEPSILRLSMELNLNLPQNSSSSIISTTSTLREPSYASLLENMFRIESVTEISPYTPDELQAEEYFRKSCSRLPNGRFSVGLPFSKNPSLLRPTRQIAIRRLFQLENRHRKNPQQREAYCAFMRDYLESGHMEPVPPPLNSQITYYLPHHSVHKPDDPPTKIRVVFNASQPSPSGISLNDILLSGPRLQLDIGDVITRFRQDRYVFTADIRQMFRQIEHSVEHRDLLRIVWRFDPDLPIQDYRLKTVTYGTASAPFLAGRVLKELAVEHQNSHPSASHILQYRTYVDDINGGGNDVESAIKVRKELQSLLELGKLELRKWAANHPNLLEHIPSDHLLPSSSSICMENESDSILKVLGLHWNPNTDTFNFKPSPVMKIKTKRELASQIAKIFDPLGWLIPVTVFARVVFRNIVENSYEWDVQLPVQIVEDWAILSNQLPMLAQLQIPRHIPSSSSNQYLVGFSDASEKAYASVLYIVSVTENDSVVRLVTARARMAPIKSVTLPRLELCGAHLLASLVKKTMPLFPRLDPQRVIMYSDSTIALSWITADPAPVWKTFVGNRVAEILSSVPSHQWFHVPSSQNPADCASRGLRPVDMINHDIWWNGPKWLQKPFQDWHFNRVRPALDNENVRAETRTPRVVAATYLTLNCDLKIEERFSSYPRLQAVMAWSLRFIHNSLKRGIRRTGPLSASERRLADNLLIKRSQAQGLKEELADVISKRPKMKITKSLNLFLDSDGILRVGGRLSNAQLPYTVKHPALLPSSHCTTNMIVRWTHEWSLHVGPLGTLANIRGRYWVVNGKNVVRRALKDCTKCIRVNPKPYEPPMGDLPKERLTDIAPFFITGVDYAGPFLVRASTLRSSKKLECYLCIFLCFATKAVHIEVATDLSTPSFLLAFQSFVAIRGLPSIVWSDNGRNFLGASNELSRLKSLMNSPDHQNAVVSEAARSSIEWNFIPPHAPHFGGLWEAAVRSTKLLLRRMLRNEILDMDVFRSFVAQVSAVLNSRPLSAISSSPSDLSVLTPGHFLAFRPLTALPIDSSISARTSIRGKWQKAQYLLHKFWTQWKKEYLLDMQARTKWQNRNLPKAKVGDIVLIIDDNQPPLKWTMGRIESLLPGNDGIPRVANVKTQHGLIQRLVRKLCPLINPDGEQDLDDNLNQHLQ